jgi:hypothetical protein
MGIRDEIDALREHLEDLASGSDVALARYELIHPPRPPGLYWQLRWLAGRFLRWMEAKGIKPANRWPVGLKHRGDARDKPLLIWAVGEDPDKLRAACRRFSELLPERCGFAPVLVTDVADFAFFSRLGWLVEYVPKLSGEGLSYEERKTRFLARLYRGAPALPASAADAPWEEIRVHLASDYHSMFDAIS